MEPVCRFSLFAHCCQIAENSAKKLKSSGKNWSGTLAEIAEFFAKSRNLMVRLADKPRQDLATVIRHWSVQDGISLLGFETD
jgi:hypothetical protein